MTKTPTHEPDLLGLDLDDVLEDFAFTCDELGALGRAGYLAGQRLRVPSSVLHEAAPARHRRRGCPP